VSNPPTFSQDFGNDPKPMADGEFWTVLYQRAYLTLMNNTGYEYHQPNLALQAVTGRAATTYYNQSGFGSADVTRLLTALNQGRCVTAATKSSASYLTTDRLVESHAYTVVSVFSSGGNYYVQLRNPWAKDCRYASNDGADDGYITIRWYDFAYSMSQYCFA
jgi:hypothetical protein